MEGVISQGVAPVEDFGSLAIEAFYYYYCELDGSDSVAVPRTQPSRGLGLDSSSQGMFHFSPNDARTPLAHDACFCHNVS